MYHCRNDRRPPQIAPTNRKLTCGFRESGPHRTDDDAAAVVIRVCAPYKGHGHEMWFYPTASARVLYCYILPNLTHLPTRRCIIYVMQHLYTCISLLVGKYGNMCAREASSWFFHFKERFDGHWSD